MKLIFALLFVVGLVEISLAGLSCPDHWDLSGKSCYWFRPGIMKTWNKASEDCRNNEGYLVKISSNGEQDFITKKLESSRYKYDRWTGLHSSSAGGRFTWADGSSLGSYKNWATGEPNFSGSACVAVSTNGGKWIDGSCTSLKMYICEKPADVEVNECAAPAGPPCDENADCINTLGSYTCKCKPGFTGDGKTCEDVDECAEDPGRCDINADCTNTVGSYTCQCKPGFTGNGINCEVQWEPKGCYRERKKKVFVRTFKPSKKMSPPPIDNENFKATFELCRKAAEDKNLDLDVIGIGTKGKGQKLRRVCLTTKDGQPPGDYGKEDKKGCNIDNQGFGVGVETRVNFVYTKATAD